VRAYAAWLCGLLLPFAAACASQPPQLVLLVSVDTLRADRLGSYGSPLGLTPALDRLADGSILFETTLAPAPFTLPSVAAMLTSRLPTSLGVRSNRSILPDGVPTLAGMLRDAGWRTGAVTSNYVLRTETGIDRGFEHYDHELGAQEQNRELPERAAPETTAAAVEMLDALLAEPGGPVLLWVHYQDPHGPYTAPEDCAAEPGPPPPGVEDRDLPFSRSDRGFGSLPRYQRLGDVRQSRHYRAAYHAEIRCLDRSIGALLEAVEARGLMPETLVLMTADHGESLGERGVWFAHGSRLDDAQTRVPLLVRLPGGTGERRDELASLLDVAPTLLAAVGLDPPPGAEGRDLLQPAPRPAGPDGRVLLLSTLDEVAPELRLAVVADGQRYVRVAGAGPVQERVAPLGAESAGTAPGAGELAAMRRRLAAEVARLGPARPERRVALDADEIERLRALGYLHSD